MQTDGYNDFLTPPRFLKFWEALSVSPLVSRDSYLGIIDYPQLDIIVFIQNNEISLAHLRSKKVKSKKISM